MWGECVQEYNEEESEREYIVLLCVRVSERAAEVRGGMSGMR